MADSESERLCECQVSLSWDLMVDIKQGMIDLTQIFGINKASVKKCKPSECIQMSDYFPRSSLA